MFMDSGLQDCSFLVSNVCAQVGEAGLEACEDFLVGGGGSWPSDEQGCVYSWFWPQEVFRLPVC